MNSFKKGLLQKVTLIFLSLSVVIYFSKHFLLTSGFDIWFLAGGNVFLYLVFLVSILIHSSTAFSSNAHVFLRSINLSMIIKLFASAIAIVLYALYTKGNINSNSLLTLLGFYIIYTAVEVSSLMAAARKKNG